MDEELCNELTSLTSVDSTNSELTHFVLTAPEVVWTISITISIR